FHRRNRRQVESEQTLAFGHVVMSRGVHRKRLMMRCRYAATSSIFTLRPSDLAARFRVASVTDVFSGSSNRWIAARDVRIRAAIVLLLIRCCFIKSYTFSATARLSAAACTSSCRPCFFRKFSKLLPRCLFLLLAVFDVGIFSSQSQSSVLLWRFLCLLDESMQQDDFACVYEK